MSIGTPKIEMLNIGVPIDLYICLSYNSGGCDDMAKKQDIKAIDAWQSENVERIVIKPRKSDQITERIQIAIDRGIAKSRQAYILDAVKNALDADGIPVNEDGGLDIGE